jgi:tetratricopeptide (TPR) repeat protein
MNSNKPATDDGDVLAAARTLHQQGVAENNAGRPIAAMKLFRRSARSAQRVDVDHHDRNRFLARLAISEAMAESELNGLQNGLSAISAAREYVQRVPDPAMEVLLHLQLGYMHVRGGHFAAGLSQLDQAVRLLDHAEPVHRCNILMNRGMAHLYLGQLPAARADFVRVVELSHEASLVTEEAKARHNLGCVEFLAGNLALALTVMDESRALGADISAAVILIDRAKVLLAAGLHRDADEVLQEAGELFRQDRLFKDVGEVELTRAECALLADEADAARRLGASARDRFRRRGNDSWRRLAELVLLQADLAAGRPASRLIKPAQRLVAEFHAVGLLPQSRLAQLIEIDCLIAERRLAEAAQLIGRSRSGAADSVSARLYLKYLRASLARAAGDDVAARGEVRRGLDELSSYQARFGSIDLQSGSAIHGRRLVDLDLALAQESGRPAAVVEAVERGRAVSSRLVPVKQPEDLEVAQLLAELRQAHDALREDVAGPRAIELSRRIAELQRQLRSHSWRVGGSGSARRPARIGQIRAGLAEFGAVLVSFLQVGDELSAVSDDGTRSTMCALAAASVVGELGQRVRADLDVLASMALPDPMRRAVTASLNRSLARLDKILVAPLQLSDRRLVIVPTGVLAMLPWGMFPSLVGRPVVVAPSATAWLAARTAPRSGALSVSALAGPDLLRAADEVRTVAKLWADVPVSATVDSGRDQFVTAISGARVVHVAAHGQHQAENPLFSSVRLADGSVFAYELDQNVRTAEHVVLSACEVGRATIRPGDEALGLTSVLLRLGTRSVVSGVARVRDDVAAEVMIAYHELLAVGVDSSQALATACASSYDAPAPFVCFGSTWRR